MRIAVFVFLASVTVMAQGTTPGSTQTAKPATTAPKAPASPAKPAGTKPAAVTTAKPATAKPAATTPAARRPATAARPAAPLTDDEKTIYVLGLLMQQSLGTFDLSAAELDIVKRALTDAANGKPAYALDEWGPKIDPLARTRRERVAVREKAASATYLAKAAAEVGAVKSESGLVYRDITAGTGASPMASDRVRVHYRGTLINGTEFDSSYTRNEPAEFALAGVVPCWTEGVQKMKAGGKARLVCPSALAYGDNGAPGIPGGSALIFDIELLEVLGR